MDKRLSDYLADVISGTLRINEKSQRKPFHKPHRRRRKRRIQHFSSLERIELPFDLRKYQEEAAEALLKHKHGSIVMPTATGKTAIAIECMKRLGLRTAILVPTCLTGDTIITMGDGSKKRIDEVKLDDVIYCVPRDALARRLKTKVVRKIQYNTHELLKVTLKSKRLLRILKITGDHVVLTKRGWLPVKELTTNDKMLATSVASPEFRALARERAIRALKKAREALKKSPNRHKGIEAMKKWAKAHPELVKANLLKAQSKVDRAKQKRIFLRYALPEANKPENIRKRLMTVSHHKSKAQALFYQVLNDLGIVYEKNYPVTLENGSTVYIDAALPTKKVGIEYDGWYGHYRPDGIAEDKERDEALGKLGWMIFRLRVTNRYCNEETSLRQRKVVINDYKLYGKLAKAEMAKGLLKIINLVSKETRNPFVSWVRVASIEKKTLRNPVKVYDLQVESEHHNFIANGLLVSNCNLMDQWVEKLQESKVYASRFYGKEHRLGNPTVFIYNSALIHKYALNGFTFVICDEAHHLGGNKFRQLLPIIAAKPYALGLTSHLGRSDRMEFLIKRVLPVIYTMPIAKAQREKYIAPLRIFQVKAKMTYQERSKYEGYCNTIRKAYGYFGTTNPSELVKINHPLARACLAAFAKRKVLLSNIEDKKDKVLQLVRKYPKERVLLFSESIRCVNTLRKYLTRNGVPCGVYHSEIKLSRRRQALDLWKDQVYNVLLSCRALEEGTDVPQARIGIIVASGSSTRQWIQRVGRLLRKRPGMTEGVAYIVYCPGTIESGYGRKVAWILAKK